MKYLLYVLFPCLALQSCSEPRERREALSHALSVMDEHPDSALLILDSLGKHEPQFGSGFRMRYRLHRINALNKLDTVFRSTAEMQALADYFNSHGTANEQMLACYLLGRAYYDTGESPMALRCFHDAVAKADTTAGDCNFGQLSRVYGQMSTIFYKQKLWNEDLKYTELEIRYAWKDKDTLNALLAMSGKARIYKNLLEQDSAIYICEHVSDLFRQYGYDDYAAATLGLIIRPLINKGRMGKAKQYIDRYESESGFFDSNGDIEHGREVFYYSKGMYYLAMHKHDSAEYYFRKELQNGKDFNNQNAASRGLALLFLKINYPDSAAKYALYSYEMNDSCYSQMTTDKVKEIQAMYDYNRSQEIAQKEKHKASLIIIWFGISVSVFTIIIAIVIYKRAIYKREKQENEQKYNKKVEDLVKMQQELVKARSHEIEYKELIDNMERQVEQLNAEVNEYHNKNYKRQKTAKECWLSSDEYKKLDLLVAKGQTLSDEELEHIHKLVVIYFPRFYEFISSQRFSLNKNEFNVCLFIRLYIKPNNVCHLLNVSPSYVSKMRSEMLHRLFGVTGKPKEFDERIQNIT